MGRSRSLLFAVLLLTLSVPAMAQEGDLDSSAVAARVQSSASIAGMKRSGLVDRVKVGSSVITATVGDPFLETTADSQAMAMRTIYHAAGGSRSGMNIAIRSRSGAIIGAWGPGFGLQMDVARKKRAPAVSVSGEAAAPTSTASHELDWAAGAKMLGLCVFWLGLIGGAIFLYSLPAIVAHRRHHHQRDAITVLTVVAGWSVIGWIVAIVWASSQVRERPA